MDEAALKYKKEIQTEYAKAVLELNNLIVAFESLPAEGLPPYLSNVKEHISALKQEVK